MDIYNRKQEIVNSITHALGILFGIISMPFLLSAAIAKHNTLGIVGCAVYSFSYLMVFVSSTVYHMCHRNRLKDIMRIFDHISIYFFIAGTYTPFLLVYMNDAFGMTLLCVLWGLTLFGIVFKAYFTNKYEIVSTIIYLAMGWIMFAGGRTFFTHLPAQILAYIIAGGVLYSIGVFFYIWDKYKYTHAVWHMFVLCAAVFHFVAVWLIVSPK
jgi:hemolysin III